MHRNDELAVTAIVQGTFLTVDVEFLVKHPSRLDDPTPALDPAIYADAIDRLFRPRTILTATDWQQSSNSKSFRPPTEQDRMMILRSYAAAREVILKTELPQRGPDLEFCVVSEMLDEVRFGCVTGRFTAVVAALSLSANVAMAAVAVKQGYFDRPNVSIGCSIYVTGAEEVNRHVRNAMRYQPEHFLNSEISNCVMLRQRLLANHGFYTGAIDGKYGNLTIQAETKAFEHLNLGSADIIELYTRLTLKNSPLPPR